MPKFYIHDGKGKVVRETTLEEIVANLKQSAKGKKIDWNTTLSSLANELVKYSV